MREGKIVGGRRKVKVSVCIYGMIFVLFFFFKQKTAYEIGTGDWSSDVCSSDLKNIGTTHF